MINSNDLGKIISDLKDMKTNIVALQEKYEELKGGLNSKQCYLALLTKEKKLIDEIVSDYPQYEQDKSKIDELKSTYKTIINSLGSEIQSTEKVYFDRLNRLHGVKMIIERKRWCQDQRNGADQKLKKVRNSFFEYILFCWRTDKDCFSK